MKIKYKTILIFLVFILIFMGSYIFCSEVFLEKYYISRNIQKIKTISQNILKENKNIDDMSQEIVSFTDSKNINIIIMDNDFNVLKILEEEKPLLFDVIQLAIEKNKQKIEENKLLTFKIDIKKDVNEKKVFCANKIDDGYLIIVESISDIKESVDIANEFFIIFSLFLAIIYLILIYIIANKITRPIRTINDITKNMAMLNFDEKIEIKSKDELGELSKNINILSEELYKNINILKDDINMKKELIRNISHELKTPIGIIKGYTEGLKFDIVTEKEDIENYYNIIISETDRMDSLIKNLLEYSKLESNILKPNYTNFYVSKFLERIIYKFKLLLKERAIYLDINCDEKLEIIADENLLENAINNFLTNAITYVKFENVIKISVQKTNGYTQISVFNTGDNIAEQELNKIWDVFYKIDKSRNKRESTGIGLSFVKAIADIHKGKVLVENIEKGVVFSIFIKDDLEI